MAAYLDTLERIKTLRARLFVPAHAEAAEDVTPLADYNIAKVHEIAGQIVDCVPNPAPLSGFFSSYLPSTASL